MPHQSHTNPTPTTTTIPPTTTTIPRRCACQVESIDDMKRFIAEHGDFQKFQNNVTKVWGVVVSRLRRSRQPDRPPLLPYKPNHRHGVGRVA
eukprot:365520-Chlamydomonas_euryale.AAC.23